MHHHEQVCTLVAAVWRKKIPFNLVSGGQGRPLAPKLQLCLYLPLPDVLFADVAATTLLIRPLLESLGTVCCGIPFRRGL